MRALITGSNGFLGTWLARRLSERGDEVRCLVRRSSATWGLQGLKVELCEGDVTEAASLTAAMSGVEVVFHLAGIRRAPTRALFDAVNAEGTRNVCEAMLAARTPRRLVHAGSLSASGPSSPDRPHTEEDPLRPFEWYGESKKRSEEIAFSYADRFEVAVARPPRILGPGDKENLVFFKLVKKGVKLKIGGGPRPLSMIDVEDVVEFLLLLADRPQAAGQAFFAAADEVTTLDALQARLAEVMQAKVRTLYLPAAALTTLSTAADAVSIVTGKHLPLNRKLARQLLAPAWTCSTEKARRLLGFKPRWTLMDSIDRSAKWYAAQGWI